MRYINQIKLVTAALMAAITCVVTMMIPIQIPFGNGGYIHPGDAFVLLSGIILGPVYGGISAGIGSMMADFLSSYAIYAPATLVIKFLAASVAAYTYRRLIKRSVVTAGVFAGIIVTLGYFLCDSLFYGTFKTAIVAIPFNILQNIIGIILASIILPLLIKVPQVRTMIKG
jgi:uncharacterized membrane protein